MSIQIKTLLLLFGLTSPVGLTAQTLKAEIFNQEDSLIVMFANVELVDSTGNILTVTSTNDKGEFTIQIPSNAHFMRIFKLPEFAELRIVNLNQEFSDTLNLGQFPMIKAPTYLHIQFIGMSKRKERRDQRQNIRSYNKEVKNYDDLVVELNNQTVRLNVNSEKQEKTDRLRLMYLLDFGDLMRKN